MAKKTNKIKPDTILKDYWRGNRQFADLFNAVLFKGAPVIQPEELEDLDTEDSFTLKHRRYAESIQASRDNIKIRKRSTAHGVELMMLGNESQEYIDYAMPMRVMGYDYGTYKKQYEVNAKKYRGEKSLAGDEHLSRMKKTDRFMPVVTVVVYYGEKPWDAATSLHGILQIDDKVSRYVNDYKIQLVEARKNDLRLKDRDNIDLFNLLELLLDAERPAKEIKENVMVYLKEHTVDRTVVMTAVGAVNAGIDHTTFEEGEDADMFMSKVFRDTWAEGEAIGREEGEAKGIVETGEAAGLTAAVIIQMLQDRQGISLQRAQEYHGKYSRESVAR